MSINTGRTASAPQAAQASAGYDTNNSGSLGGGNMNNNPGKGGLFDFTESLQLPVSSTDGAKAIADFKETYEKIREDNSIWITKLLVLDNTNETNWRYSTVAIAVTSARNPTSVALYPMTLASTASAPLEPFTQRVGDLEFKMDSVPAMAMDDNWRHRLEDLAQEAFPDVSGDQITIIAGMVVPEDRDLTNIREVRTLVKNAVLACVTLLVEVLPGFTDVDLTLLSPDVTPIMRLESTPNANKVDIVGAPVRQDFAMTFSARKTNQPQQEKNNHSLNELNTGDTTWGSMSAYLDISYAPATNSLYSADPTLRTRLLGARAIITDIDQKKLSTAASTALMLVMSTCLAAQNVWHGLFYNRMKEFQNKHPDAVIDPTDVGLLNMITKTIMVQGSNEPEPVVLLDATGDLQLFVDFMNRSFHEEVHVAIDVPHTGPTSWFIGLYSAMANGDQAAMHEFVRAMDKVTGGSFSRTYFQNYTPQMQLQVNMFFSEVNNVFHMGHYTAKSPDGEPEVRDLRTIDFNYVFARLGRNDPAVMQKWSQSWLVGNDLAIRLAGRMDIYEACVNKPVVTGYGSRHTLRSELLVAMWNCVTETGLVPELKYVDPLQGASAGLNAPAYMTTSGLNVMNMNSSYGRQAGGNKGGGMSLGSIGQNSGRWANR